MTNQSFVNDDEPAGDDDLAPPAAAPFVASAADVGERLDRFLVAALPDLSRSFISQLIRDDAILLNGRSTKPGQQLRQGDSVTVQIPPPQVTDIVAEDLPLQIVYEDDDVVVINKAAGMVVHPAPGHTSGTLVNALLFRYPDMQVGSDLRPGIVHRLDRDTSGLIVAVRNDRARRLIVAQQQAHTMRKAYLAVIEGRMKELEGVIDAPLGRHSTDRLRQAVTATGRHARTHYRVIETLGDYTLVEALLETGRTHQIRVHFAWKQRPVLGDPLYGPRHPRSTFGLHRQFLHAYELGFVLPKTNTWQQFEAPLPADLATVLEKLQRLAA